MYEHNAYQDGCNAQPLEHPQTFVQKACRQEHHNSAIERGEYTDDRNMACGKAERAGYKRSCIQQADATHQTHIEACGRTQTLPVKQGQGDD